MQNYLYLLVYVGTADELRMFVSHHICDELSTVDDAAVLHRLQ